MKVKTVHVSLNLLTDKVAFHLEGELDGSDVMEGLTMPANAGLQIDSPELKEAILKYLKQFKCFEIEGVTSNG